MSRISSSYIEKKDPVSGKKRRLPYGNVTNVKVVKSKIDAKQGHSCEIFIRYGLGVDDYLSVIESGVAQKLIKKEGAYYALGEHRFQGKEKFRTFLVENGAVYDALKAKLAEAILASGIDGPVEVEEDDDILENFDMNSDSDDTPNTDDEVTEEELESALEAANAN
jgi:recombination protein RecA